MKFIYLPFLIVFFINCYAGETSFGRELIVQRGDKDLKIKIYRDSLKITWVKTIISAINLRFVVKAEIYPEDPNTLVLTSRKGGVTLLDISMPENPQLIQHWGKSGLDVEGQDRRGNLLVVIGRRGDLYLFNILQNKNIKLIKKMKIPGLGIVKGPLGPFIPALHTRLYKKNNKLYAMITCPTKEKLVAIDVTNPKNPVYVSSKKTWISGLEGIQIYKDHAFLGGFSDVTYGVYDISNPASIRKVNDLSSRHFVQMVPEMSANYPNIIFVALFGMKGGLATFNVANPKKIVYLDKVVTKALGKANRVKIRKNMAFLPLRQSVGGLGVIDISDPNMLRKVMEIKSIPGVLRPYTLNYKDNIIYVFGSHTYSMGILKVEE